MNNDNKKLSQLDPGGVLKSAHDFDSDSLRVVNATTSVPSEYSSVLLTHNTAGSVTNARFYGKALPNITNIKTIAATGLNNKYFFLNPVNDYRTYYIWFNVDGAGVDPSPAGDGIEIPLVSSDTDVIVAKSIAIFVGKLEGFIVEACESRAVITNNEYGTSSGAYDGNSGFIFNTDQVGTESLIKSIDIPFTEGVRYVYNEQDRRFEIQGGVNIDGSINVNIVNAPSSNEAIVTTYSDVSSIATGSLTVVTTYTVPVGKVAFLQRVEGGGENIATYQVEINAVIKAKRRTYFGSMLTTDFVFAESTENGVELASGDVVRLRVEHGRPFTADFEGRIQVLEIG